MQPVWLAAGQQKGRNSPTLTGSWWQRQASQLQRPLRLIIDEVGAVVQLVNKQVHNTTTPMHAHVSPVHLVGRGVLTSFALAGAAEAFYIWEG